ncbi:MAG: molybdopterin oxidoreductase family protein [Anaerolineales bacterium]|nr:molybdopterin oxidoreductase family protein [Anaerolineales bacterium]
MRHPKLDRYQNDPALRIISGCCPHDCPDSCSWQLAVERESGRAIDIWGHPDHPVTQGKLCGKVDRYLDRSYHPDRLTSPLRRVGPKGAGQFAPISWDEAIDEIATRLQRIIDHDGAEAIAPYSYAGTMGVLQGEGMASRFFNFIGASRLARTICSEAGFEGYAYTTGKVIGMETQDYRHAKLILIWGSNTLTSNLHLWPFVQEARRSGARVIVIDPARTRTARAADEWLPIQPGTDGALALAMMHVIVNEALYDADYVASHCHGFDKLRVHLQRYSPQWAAPLTGIDAARIEVLARDYATARPAAIRVNYGLQRHAGGGAAMRAISCLPALVGAWRQQGGGIQLSSSGSFPLDYRSLRRPDAAQRLTREFNMNRLGDMLSRDPAKITRAHHHPRPVDPQPTPDAAGPPVKALIVYNCNPAAVAPDQSAVVAGLQRYELFTVVLEHFPTDTVDYADIVLPATTQIEHWDILKPYGHLYLALNRPAIAPLGESLPNSEIFRRLGRAMGGDEALFGQSDETMLQAFVESQHDALFEGITWDRLLAENFVRLNLPQPFLPFAHGNYPTESGKCEFFSERAARDGYDPLPTWAPPLSLTGAAESLRLISPPAHNFLNSSFVNVPRLQQREGRPALWMHPADAAERQLHDGDWLRLWNAQGEVELPLRITDEIVAGTLLAPGIWWSKLSPDGRNINQLTPQTEADLGAGALFYDVRVQVERVAPTAPHSTPAELIAAD